MQDRYFEGKSCGYITPPETPIRHELPHIEPYILAVHLVTINPEPGDLLILSLETSAKA